MPQPSGFTWVDKPHLAALARPQDPEELTWLRRQGIELLISLTEDPLRREWLLHRMEEYSRNWAAIGAYAIAFGIMNVALGLRLRSFRETTVPPMIPPVPPLPPELPVV